MGGRHSKPSPARLELTEDKRAERVVKQFEKSIPPEARSLLTISSNPERLSVSSIQEQMDALVDREKTEDLRKIVEDAEDAVEAKEDEVDELKKKIKEIKKEIEDHKDDTPSKTKNYENANSNGKGRLDKAWEEKGDFLKEKQALAKDTLREKTYELEIFRKRVFDLISAVKRKNKSNNTKRARGKTFSSFFRKVTGKSNNNTKRNAKAEYAKWAQSNEGKKALKNVNDRQSREKIKKVAINAAAVGQARYGETLTANQIKKLNAMVAPMLVGPLNPPNASGASGASSGPLLPPDFGGGSRRTYRRHRKGRHTRRSY